jgi:pyruvate kinase
MARTKIVATIGPSSDSPDTIRKMIDAGMTVARVNFSHGDHESNTASVAMLRKVADEAGVALAIMGDLQGPKLRLGYVRPGGIALAVGEEIVLTPHRGQPAMIHLPHPMLLRALLPGAALVIGDGELELDVVDKKSDTVRCRVTVAGRLEARKGVSAPGTELPISSITAKDKSDLELICKLRLDYVALSFVRSAQDIHELRELMANEGVQIPIIAKIEKSEAIENLESIRDAADGIMVARGDLGIEVPPQEVPLLQKRIIGQCNDSGKPVITATQMLQSMVDHPRPTRAEASDVANAILDGTDAVMLSGETAAGRFPVESVLMMRQISENTEREFPYEEWRRRRRRTPNATASTAEAISAACCEVAEQVRARVIVSATNTGYTAQKISRHRPSTAVMAVTTSQVTQRRLSLVWGVDCLVVHDFADTDEMLEVTVETLRPFGLESGDRVVITAGVPFGASSQSNLIQVHEVQ